MLKTTCYTMISLFLLACGGGDAFTGEGELNQNTGGNIPENPEPGSLAGRGGSTGGSATETGGQPTEVGGTETGGTETGGTETGGTETGGTETGGTETGGAGTENGGSPNFATQPAFVDNIALPPGCTVWHDSFWKPERGTILLEHANGQTYDGNDYVSLLHCNGDWILHCEDSSENPELGKGVSYPTTGGAALYCTTKKIESSQMEAQCCINLQMLIQNNDWDI